MNLNDAQKSSAIKAIKAGENEAALNNSLELAQKLDAKTGELKAEVLAGVSETDLNNATKESRLAYENALTLSQALLMKKSGENADTNEVQRLIDALKLKKEELMADANINLTKAKNSALQSIHEFDALNKAQDRLAQENIQNAKTVDTVKDAVAKANLLNDKMTELLDVASDSKMNAILNSDAYKFASKTRKHAIDQALKAAKDLLTYATGENASLKEVQAVIDALKVSASQLDGKAKTKANSKHTSKTRAQLPAAGTQQPSSVLGAMLLVLGGGIGIVSRKKKEQ